VSGDGYLGLNSQIYKFAILKTLPNQSILSLCFSEMMARERDKRKEKGHPFFRLIYNQKGIQRRKTHKIMPLRIHNNTHKIISLSIRDEIHFRISCLEKNVSELSRWEDEMSFKTSQSYLNFPKKNTLKKFFLLFIVLCTHRNFSSDQQCVAPFFMSVTSTATIVLEGGGTSVVEYSSPAVIMAAVVCKSGGRGE
jgi:hypothetical protein